MPDVIVVGAGVVGASTAFHLAERGIETLVVDRGMPASGSTGRSGALVRCHYPTALEADLAWESLTGYFERWGERVGGGCGFTRTGFARLASKDEREATSRTVSMLRDRVGVETSLIGSEELGDLDGSLCVEDVSVAAYEPRGGYADPSATTVSFLKRAKDLGARFERTKVEALIEDGDKIRGVRTGIGDLEAPVVVLAAGCFSVGLASGVGLELPIRPARVQVLLLWRPYSVPTHLTLIDTLNNVYARPTADHCTLVGMRLPEAEWLEDPDGCVPTPDPGFTEQASRRIAGRLPALQAAAQKSGWAGVIDVTPDERPVLGPEGPEGLFIATGWSGAGFKKAPAVGAELTRWIVDGAPKRKVLKDYNLDRFKDGNLILDEYAGTSTGPH